MLYYEGNKSKNQIQEWCNIFFLFMCGLNIVFQYLKNISMIQIAWPEKTYEYLVAFLLASLILKLITMDGYKLSNLFLCAVIIVVCYIEWNVNGGPEILYFAVFIVGMQGISAEKIIKIFTVLGTVLLAGTVIAAYTGHAENLIYYRGSDIRIAFGTVYPTIFASQILYLYMGYIYLRRRVLKIYDFVIGIILAFGVYFLCDARMSAGCIILLTVGSFIIFKWSQTNKELKVVKIIEGVVKCSPAICCLGIMTLTIFYDKQNKVLNIINQIASNRLLLGKEGFKLYGVTAWGINFPQYGNGGTTEAANNYFYIDSAYISYLLRYGLIILLVVVGIMMLINYKAAAQKEYILLWILTVVAFHGMVEDRILAVTTNPFLWLVLANIGTDREKGKGSANVCQEE